MKTPICDFAKAYAHRSPVRLHTPGHKGQGFLGFENLDITELNGADDLYCPTGIIRESEENAGKLFGCHTFYATEGSSQCIRAMVYLAMLWAKSQGKTPRIAAGRNAHRTFLSAVALLDVNVDWLFPEEADGYLSCRITPERLEALFTGDAPPTAVYVTSPDYLGQMADIRKLAEVCHRHGCLLLVDNAHGAYLKFLDGHPMELGAHMCCDSAHKTLGVLTGGAYLHIAEDFEVSADDAKISGVVTSVTFKGVHYDIVVDAYDFSWLIQSTKIAEVGSTVGITFGPDDIHIMNKMKG